jgi:hypothetical protein
MPPVITGGEPRAASASSLLRVRSSLIPAPDTMKTPPASTAMTLLQGGGELLTKCTTQEPGSSCNSGMSGSSASRRSTASGFSMTMAPAATIPLDPCFPRVLHAEDAPCAGQCTAQRRLVIEVALDDFDAMRRERRRPLAIRLARQAAQMQPSALRRTRSATGSATRTGRTGTQRTSRRSR